MPVVPDLTTIGFQCKIKVINQILFLRMVDDVSRFVPSDYWFPDLDRKD